MKQIETMNDASSHARHLYCRHARSIVVTVFVSVFSVACVSERASHNAPGNDANVAMPSPVLTSTPESTSALTPSPEITPTPSTATAANPFAEYNELTRRDSKLETSPPIGASGDLSNPSQLLIPVAGITKEQLTDTFTASRSEGRRHNALDIIAPRGTPVLAATDGRLLRKFTSVKGGLTIYQIGTDERTIYYYSHLDRYAEGLSDNQMLRRGDVIGYVGDTGNSGAGNYHLHFAMWTVTDPKRFYDGDNINPYPLLMR